MKSISYNAEIDVIWEKWQATLDPLRAALNEALGQRFEEWQVPREPGDGWPPNAKDLHGRWWEARIARQQEIDDSIARAADGRAALRQALRASEQGPRRRAVHGREPVAASRRRHR